MSLGCDRRVCAFSLVVLILGLLSTEVDMLLDHAPVHTEHSACLQGHSGPQHLVSNEYGAKVPPCNACLFHKLLAHSLVPSRDLITATARSIDSSELQPLSPAESFLRREKSRSPPLG